MQKYNIIMLLVCILLVGCAQEPLSPQISDQQKPEEPEQKIVDVSELQDLDSQLTTSTANVNEVLKSYAVDNEPSGIFGTGFISSSKLDSMIESEGSVESEISSIKSASSKYEEIKGQIAVSDLSEEQLNIYNAASSDFESIALDKLEECLVNMKEYSHFTDLSRQEIKITEDMATIGLRMQTEALNLEIDKAANSVKEMQQLIGDEKMILMGKDETGIIDVHENTITAYNLMVQAYGYMAKSLSTDDPDRSAAHMERFTEKLTEAAMLLGEDPVMNDVDDIDTWYTTNIVPCAE